MSADLLKIVPSTDPVQAVDAALVSRLEELLARARAGEINGALFVLLESTGGGSLVSVATCWAGEGALQNVHGALGGVEVLKARWLGERIAG